VLVFVEDEPDLTRASQQQNQQQPCSAVVAAVAADRPQTSCSAAAGYYPYP